MLVGQNLITFTSFDTLGNFAECNFKIKNVQFCCTEQAFAYFKAMFAKDYEIAKRILETRDPFEVLKLEKAIICKDAALWFQKMRSYMKTIQSAKVAQNEYIQKMLIATGCTNLGYATKYDRYFGIGFDEKDDRTMFENLWIGQNELGKILTEIRREYV